MRRLLTAAALVALLIVLVPAARGDGSGSDRVVAEFESARGLVEGNDVRIAGAPAGTVSGIELSESGTALVTLELHDGLPPLRADASAAIRPVDLLGDNYVALEPGTEGAELEGEIPAGRTLNAPRLDDLLRVFGAGERAGLKALLVEAGIGLDRQGAALNESLLALRPTLESADALLAELGSENAGLGDFVADAERAAGQAASREDELGRTIGAAEAVLAETAEHDAGLDATLAAAPGGLADLRELAGRLGSTAEAARPAVESLRRATPGLTTAMDRLEPFLDSAGGAAGDLEPVMSRLADVLSDHRDTLSSFDSAFGELSETTPAFRDFLAALAPAAPAISEGFFVNFPDQAAEPGTQPFDPFADPRRHYWRGAALLTCQSFGVPIEPGCLSGFLASSAPKRAGKEGDHKDGTSSGDGSADGDGAAADDGGSTAPTGDPAAPDGSGSAPGIGGLPLPTEPGAPTAPTTPAAPQTPGAAGDLFDFLLGS